MGGRLGNKNIDFLHGGHWPLQTYAFSGQQWGAALDAENGKRKTDGPPMIITSQPPGSFTSADKDWESIFGASHDAVFTVFNGQFLEDNIQTDLDVVGIYRDALPNATRQNLYRALPDSETREDLVGEDAPEGAAAALRKAQIQFVVSETGVATARNLMKTNTPPLESDSRGIAMRYPMMMAGWGKTVAIRPTDPEVTRDDNKRKNDFEHAFARETWKHGAVDLRWDKRTAMWRGWNDLIADHEKKDLGTLVFSTNPDAAGGFPFLKGKLEDVWWVRRTSRFKDVEVTAGQEDDFIQTGEICTHLGHKFYDDAKKNAGPLTDIFLVDVTEDPSPESVGDETTSNGRIEIKTSAFFHATDSAHGPVCFTSDGPEPDDLVGCMKFDGATFVPTVTFDPCDHGPTANALDILYANDESIIADLDRVINAINDLTDDTDGSVDGSCEVRAATGEGVTVGLQTLHSDLLKTLNGAIEAALQNVQEALGEFAGIIAACIPECGITTPIIAPLQIESAAAPTVSDTAIEGSIDGVAVISVDVSATEHPPVEAVDPCEQGAQPIPPPGGPAAGGGGAAGAPSSGGDVSGPAGPSTGTGLGNTGGFAPV